MTHSEILNTFWTGFIAWGFSKGNFFVSFYRLLIIAYDFQECNEIILRDNSRSSLINIKICFIYNLRCELLNKDNSCFLKAFFFLELRYLINVINYINIINSVLFYLPKFSNRKCFHKILQLRSNNEIPNPLRYIHIACYAVFG